MPETFLSIDALLERMVARNASDLHVTVGTPPAMRVNGTLERYQDIPELSAEDTHQMLYRVLSTEQQKLLEINRQIDFAHSIPGLARFRVNVFFQRGTLGAAFRLIPADIKTLEELGIPTALHALTEKPRGLVLITGPTGSGKSTTLAALIDEINRKRSEHILTIEDPVEFVHRHKRCIVNQREIGPDASSFATASGCVMSAMCIAALPPAFSMRPTVSFARSPDVFAFTITAAPPAASERVAASQMKGGVGRSPSPAHSGVTPPRRRP